MPLCRPPDLTSQLPTLLGTGSGQAALTGDAGDTQDVGIADGELVYNSARLVGINDHHFAGGQSAGEDPHPAGGGVRLGEVLCLSEHGRQGRCLSVSNSSSSYTGSWNLEGPALPLALEDTAILPVARVARTQNCTLYLAHWLAQSHFHRRL